MLHAATLLLMVAGVGQVPQPVGKGPEPSPTPISWEFSIRHDDPRRIVVQLPGSETTETYWYMVYTVVNRSGSTQRFHPTFQLVTENLDVIDTDMGISPLVFDAIRERHRLTHPYLVHPTLAIGDLKAGEDNARESVAIWRGVDVDVNRFTIYIAGLSGETLVLRNPSFDPNRPVDAEVEVDGRTKTVTVNPRHFTLRKTLELRYAIPGSPAARRTAEPVRESSRWIMR